MDWILKQLYAMRTHLKGELKERFMDEFEISRNHERQLEITRVIGLIETDQKA